MEHLKYPIGRFNWPETTTPTMVKDWIATIEAQPAKYDQLISGLSEEELNLTYRPGGWTIRQVMHHVVDSHINSFVRFKWTLTEDNPTIKAYYEDRWATLEDYKQTPVIVSLSLLKVLHLRWVTLLKSLTPTQLKRTFVHPENGKTIRLDQLISLYAWHGNHHIGHIELALKNK
jgi:uncharacterized damage-inducible protein DinB